MLIAAKTFSSFSRPALHGGAHFYAPTASSLAAIQLATASLR